jgi:hypothetical protein
MKSCNLVTFFTEQSVLCGISHNSLYMKRYPLRQTGRTTCFLNKPFPALPALDRRVICHYKPPYAYCGQNCVFCLRNGLFCRADKALCLQNGSFCPPNEAFCLANGVFCLQNELCCLPNRLFCLPNRAFCLQNEEIGQTYRLSP